MGLRSCLEKGRCRFYRVDFVERGVVGDLMKESLVVKENLYN